MTNTNRVIELCPRAPRGAGFDFSGCARRAERRFRAAELRRNLAAGAELLVTAAIGVGFTVCVLLFFTML